MSLSELTKSQLHIEDSKTKEHRPSVAAMHGIASTDVSSKPALLPGKLKLAPYRKPRWLMCAAIATNLGVLAFVGIPAFHTVTTGQTIFLESRPYEPWDPFRGEYVTLNYTIASMPSTTQYTVGQPVYVVLAKAEPFWKGVRVTEKLPATHDGEVALKATVSYCDKNTVNLDYKLGQAFVPEGEGKRLQGKKLRVEIVVDKSGNAVLRSVKAA